MTRAITVQLQVDDEIDSAMHQAIAAHEFASTQALVEQALLDWKERRDNNGYSRAELEAEIAQGLQSPPSSLSLPEIMARARARLHG